MKNLKQQVESQMDSKYKYKEAFEKFQKEQECLLEDIESKKVIIDDLRRDIKAEALEVYNKDGTKKFDCGVGIRIMNKIEYDINEAFDWAKEHQMALSLDKKAFEKISKVDTPDFVRISEVATATIPMKL